MNVKKIFVHWLAKKLPACKEVTRMASDSMERKLPLRKQIGMRLHFMICIWCLRYFKQLQLMSEIAHRHNEQTGGENSSPTSSLSPEARERMKRRLGA